MSIQSPTGALKYQIGDWLFDPSQNVITQTITGEQKRLEPKVGELLNALVQANGAVMSKPALLDTIWTGVIVSDDTLARTVSRLRAALNDSASNPKYIETIPKKGYRLKTTVSVEDDQVSNKDTSHPKHIVSGRAWAFASAVLIVSLTFFFGLKSSTIDTQIQESLARADGLYMTFNEQNNEAALALYESVLELDTHNAKAQAGVANAMVQRLVRWPSDEFSIDASKVSLTKALSTGQLATPESKLMLERARLIAEKAVRLNPKDTHAIKSLGFVYSAENKIEQAIAQYQRAVELDSTAWRSLINLGEMYALSGDEEKAIETFILAFHAMQARYSEEPQHIGPWQPEMGKSIARRFLERGEFGQSIRWSEDVLKLVPFEREATRLLILALRQNEQFERVKEVCSQYATKLEPLTVCSTPDDGGN